MDIVAPETPLLDTLLQTVEVLRDASHVRDYRVSEWQAMLTAAGFRPGTPRTWKLPMAFDSWIARIRTPQVRRCHPRPVRPRAGRGAGVFRGGGRLFVRHRRDDDRGGLSLGLTALL